MLGLLISNENMLKCIDEELKLEGLNLSKSSSSRD
jgi:hypothetical protein